MQSEEEFLKALAERPADRALRLVFCDWLLERGDPRGEAMALFDKGTLSAVERRQLERLQQVNASKWLGPLAQIAVIEKCRFAGGLLHTLQLPANVNGDLYQALTGEIRLGTVERIVIHPGRVGSRLGGFLAHPVLGQVSRLEADAGTLVGAAGFASVPRHVEVTLWHPLEELTALAGCVGLKGTVGLSLNTRDGFDPPFAEELANAAAASGVLVGRTRVDASPSFATLEGAAHWLRTIARVPAATRKHFERWGVTYAEVQLGLEGHKLEDLIIDISADGQFLVATQVGTAASVLVQLDGVGIRRVEVRHVPGGRLKKHEVSTLRAAARRLTGLEDFKVAGVSYPP